MNGTRARAVAILFLVVLLLVFLLAPREGLAEEPAFQMSFGWAVRLVGGVIAVVAAVEILFLAIQRTPRDLPMAAAVLLAGLSLTSPWPALGLAALAVAFLVLPRMQAEDEDQDEKAPAARRKKRAGGKE